MEDYFLEKYKSKSSKELQVIIDNKDSYQIAAVNAAIQLLNQTREEPAKIIKPEPISNDHNSILEPHFNVTPFLRTFSYREFLTCFSLSLVFIAIAQFLDYYSNEKLFEHSHGVLLLVFAIILFLSNHIYYLIEHKRQNNFIGRVFIDSLFILFLISTSSIYHFILDSNFGFSMEISGAGAIGVILGLAILIFTWELLVAVLKYFLKEIRCQIL